MMALFWFLVPEYDILPMKVLDLRVQRDDGRIDITAASNGIIVIKKAVHSWSSQGLIKLL